MKNIVAASEEVSDEVLSILGRSFCGTVTGHVKQTTLFHNLIEGYLKQKLAHSVLLVFTKQ